MDQILGTMASSLIPTEGCYAKPCIRQPESRHRSAADRIGAMILGFDQVRHIQEAAKLGLGKADLEQIEIKGISIEEARNRLLD